MKEIELWTLIPAVFVCGLFIKMLHNMDWTYFFGYNFIIAGLIGLIYAGEGIYEKWHQ